MCKIGTYISAVASKCSWEFVLLLCIHASWGSNRKGIVLAPNFFSLLWSNSRWVSGVGWNKGTYFSHRANSILEQRFRLTWYFLGSNSNLLLSLFFLELNFPFPFSGSISSWKRMQQLKLIMLSCVSPFKLIFPIFLLPFTTAFKAQYCAQAQGNGFWSWN